MESNDFIQKTNNTIFTSSYHSECLEGYERSETIKRALKILTKNHLDHLPIVVTGISGMSIGFALVDKIYSKLSIVRKPGDSNNAHHKVEGYIPTSQYIILDDFIASGNTIRTIIRAIQKVSPLAKCVGIVLYQSKNMTVYYKEQFDGIPIYGQHNH